MEIGLWKCFVSCKKNEIFGEKIISQKLRLFTKRFPLFVGLQTFTLRPFFGLGGGYTYLTLLGTLKLKLKGMPKLNNFVDR